MTETATSKRNSVVTGQRAASVLANSSAPRSRTTGSSQERRPAAGNPHRSSMVSQMAQRTVSAADAQQQRERGKVIYNRDAKATEEIERERREREAIAKKAREEAAERGRQASREWAEKMMARKKAEALKAMRENCI